MRRPLDRRIDALASEQHGLIARWQALDLGMTAAAMRYRAETARWQVHRPAVYRVAGAPGGWMVDLHAAVLAGGPDACASHLAAASLHRIPGFPEGELELSVTARESPDVVGVIVHRKVMLPPHHVAQAEGIPVTTVARTLFDLAGSAHPMRVARALDNCLARDLVTRSGLEVVFDDLARRGRTGTALMRELLQARGPGYVPPASGLEARFLRALRRAELPRPAREVDVGDDRSWVGRVEFVYREARLLIEVDSRTHHTSLLDLQADKARDNRLMAAGWRILRLTDEMLRTNPDQVTALVRRALRAAS